MLSVMLYPYIFTVVLLMDLFILCVACLIFLGVVVILLLNVMEVLSLGGGALLDKPCMVFQRMSVVPVIPMCI